MLGLLKRALTAFQTVKKKAVVPFVIVGMPRTGSTLLLDCIQQHPNILAYGELFHWVRSERSGRHAIRHGQQTTFFDEKNNGVDFLCREVFNRRTPGIGATGFKLFAEYVICPGTDYIFQTMRARIPGLKIVHIVRENYLDVVISRAIAKQTGVWENRTGASPPGNRPAKVIIEPMAVLQSFERLKQADAFFSVAKGRRYHRVNYADLCTDLPRELDRVFRFLGQVPFTPDARLAKQTVRPAHEILDNYLEIRRACLGTEFSIFFQPLSGTESKQNIYPISGPAMPQKEVVPPLAI